MRPLPAILAIVPLVASAAARTSGAEEVVLRFQADVPPFRAGDNLRGELLGGTESLWVLLSARGIETVPRRSVELDRARSDQPGGAGNESGSQPGGRSGDHAAGAATATTVELVFQPAERGASADPPPGPSARRAEGANEPPRPSGGDERARSQLGFFFAHECRPALALTDPGVAGEYRLTIRATPRPPEAVEFYGTKLEVRFRCELEARLERRSDKTFELIREFSFVEDVAGRKDQDLSDRAYRKALASLVERLRASGALAGSRKPAERSLDSQEWNRISEPGQRS